jgi:hypothetical protein
MKFRFSAKIYKVGINPCVDVPSRITKRMTPVKGYIPVKGKIFKHEFTQTLVPVKDSEYRLYVNGPMMKGADVVVGDTASFVMEETTSTKPHDFKMPKYLEDELKRNKLKADFLALTPYRQKEIRRYLNNLKTEESIIRNADKVIRALKEKNGIVRIP